MKQINSMYIHIYPSVLDLPAPLPSCHHTPLGHHRAPSWAPRVTQQVPTNYLFYTRSYIYMPLLPSQFIPSLLPTSPCPCLFSMSVSLFSSVQLSHVRLFVTPWIAERQASLSITNSWSLLKLMSIESVMPSSHLILCCPLLLLSPIPPSIRVFSNESTLCMRWPCLYYCPANRLSVPFF